MEHDVRKYMVRRGYPLGRIIQTVVQEHRTNYKDKGDKPDDPGWFGCTCKAWYGYWSDFEPHVGQAIAEELVRLRLVREDLVTDLREIESRLFCSTQTAVPEGVREELFRDGLERVRDLIRGLGAEVVPGGKTDDSKPNRAQGGQS